MRNAPYGAEMDISLPSTAHFYIWLTAFVTARLPLDVHDVTTSNFHGLPAFPAREVSKKLSLSTLSLISTSYSSVTHRPAQLIHAPTLSRIE